LRNYADLFDALARHPEIRCTLSLDPVLLARFEAFEDGTAHPDPFLRAARRRPADLSAEERRFIVATFLDFRRDVLARDLPRIHELAALRGEHGSAGVPPSVVERFDDQAILDLQVLFHLAWCGGLLRADPRVRSRIERGRDFREEDKQELLELQDGFLAGVLGRLRALFDAGHVELSTGPYFHPVLPLLCDLESAHDADPSVRLPDGEFAHPEDARAQLDAARSRFERVFGAPPRGGWSPEGAISEDSLAILDDAGWGWTASDESVLYRSLGERGARGGRRGRQLYRTFRPERGPIVLFRDADLSASLAEDYGTWSPNVAATDFVHRIQRVRRSLTGESGVPTITIAVDGENVWDDHPAGCGPFLDAMFEQLEAILDEIGTVTVSEACDAEHPVELSRVLAGSWVDAGLAAWIGTPASNRAWALLSETRAAVARERGAPDAGDPAWRAILAAEGSDWFRWFASEQPGPFASDLDACFRGHLIRAWTEAGLEPPALLREPVRPTHDDTAHPPAGAVRPLLDGRITDWFEWLAAGRVDASDALVTSSALPVRSLRFGGDGTFLYLRLDPMEPPVAHALGGALLRLRFPGWPDRTLSAVVPPAGPGESGPVRVACEQVVELAVPVAELPGDGEAFRFHVEIETATGQCQRVPDAGELEIPAGADQEPEWDWYV
jgi:alpha-amylase/alpha-mannosidase (GH57 family)